ncbi:acetate kinase [Omnitrophica bacterium]|nr:acetate kinase [Candidatus Omnitrophota bacterium]
MMLIINSGSSSIKYKLFDVKSDNHLLARGVVEKIGLRGSRLRDHNAAIKFILKSLMREEGGVLDDPSEIRAVGHRVVHGGERFKGSVIINNGVIKAIRRFSRLAPLHNPPNLLGIEACKRSLPDIPQVAVFDTAFYQTLPESHYIYAIPYSLYKKDGIRRYGFHGTSHKYVAIRTAAVLKRPIGRLKIITCHLGNGCSMTATKNGKAQDTSMGFTPLEGLVMGTRSGNIDPIVILYLMERKGMKRDDIDRLLNKKSGLLGVSGVSSDMRDVYKALKRGNKRARLAFDIFIHRIRGYIGAYAAGMDGVDAITFTAGIGENHPPTRRAVCANLGFLGVRIDNRKNNANNVVISKPDSKVKVLVIPTDEELMIAKETREVIKNS